MSHDADLQHQVPIHVDAASGGFIAPFIYPDLEWDFRLPNVVGLPIIDQFCLVLKPELIAPARHPIYIASR